MHMSCSKVSSGSATIEVERGCALCCTKSFVGSRGSYVFSRTCYLRSIELNVQDGEEERISRFQGTTILSMINLVVK